MPLPNPHRGAGVLDGCRTVDLSRGIAGAYCAKVLAEAGARVLKVEFPGGDPLRRRVPEDVALPAGEDGALFSYLAASAESLVVGTSPSDHESLAELIKGADVIIWSPEARSLAPGLSPDELHTSAPHAVITAISPFGLSGPWADRPATDATLQALSGGPAWRGPRELEPLIAGGELGSWITGAIAAAALLSAYYRARSTGIGDLVDVSALECLALTQTMHQVSYRSLAGRPWRTDRTAQIPDIHRARDGFVGFIVVTGQQWQDFCVLVGHAEWIADDTLLSLEGRVAQREQLLPEIQAWVADRTVAEVIEQANLLRLPVAPIGNGASLAGFDHFAAYGFWTADPRTGARQPGPAYRFNRRILREATEPAPALGEHRPGWSCRPSTTSAERLAPPAVNPFARLRVADFTAFWAGPIVGQLLGMLGADVIHIESAHRPDGMRSQSLRPVRQDVDQWWEWSPCYLATNSNKRGLSVDLRTERGREVALRLIAECDIVIENFSPRVMESWRLSYDDITQVRPDVIMVRAPAYGLGGPWRERVGFAQSMEMVSGLAWITGHSNGPPVVPNGPADPIGGTHSTIALMLALEHRRQTGEGCLVEAPQIVGSLRFAAEQILAHSAYGILMSRQGNRLPGGGPQGCYLTSTPEPTGTGSRWVLISVATDEQWRSFCRVVTDASLRDTRFDTMQGRARFHDELDALLGRWAATRSSKDIQSLLAAAGVPVEEVLLPHELDGLAQLRARGFYEQINHPVVGQFLQAGYPARFAAHPVTLEPAPCLGEHDSEILTQLLGYSAEEYQRLVEDRIVGGGPND